VRELGADEVIDYRTTSFWEKVRDVDLVLDLVGGDALARSWQVLANSGRIVSVAAPDIAAQTPPGQRGIWLQMRVDAKRLAEIAQRIASGELRVNVSEVVALDDAAAAIERNKTGHGPGKAVIEFR
jgi:N-ethylmaleimide reductase